MKATGTSGPHGRTYPEMASRIEDRSARSAGMIADQTAGEAAAVLGLRRTAALLERLHRPQDAMPIVHVAGSKGKGSISAMVAAILTAGGHRTGRATSPHLHRYTERIAVDGLDVDDDMFVSVAADVLAAADALERDEPALGLVNAYEALFAVALVVFQRTRCVAAVVEVGIGGRLDASNVVEPSVSVITTLDLEHTAILGPTLADIAREKAGIIKPGRPVVVAPQHATALDVIRRRAGAAGSQLTVISDEDVAAALVPGRLRGPHQRVNAAVASATVAALALGHPELQADRTAIASGMLEAQLPGRFERVDPAALSSLTGLSDRLPVVVLDGAHTPLSAAALRETVAEEYGPDRRVTAVIGLSSDKDARAILLALRPDLVVPVRPRSPRSVPAEHLAATAREEGMSVVPLGDGSVFGGLVAAVRADSTTVIVVTGSFSVVAEARVALGIAGG